MSLSSIVLKYEFSALFGIPRYLRDFHESWFTKVGKVYKIHQNNLKLIQVCCNQTKDCGGRAVFQPRTDGSVDFFRDRELYKQDFGNLQNDHLLRNENFHITNAVSKNTFRVNSLTGTIADDLKRHSRHKFSTFNQKTIFTPQ